MGRQGTPRTDASRASLAHRVGAYVSAHRLRRRWLALMGVLAAVVVVVTAGALTMPASTMTADVATLPEGASVPEGYTQQYTAKDEANGITVTAYAPEGVVPEGATLKASLLAQDSDEYAAAKQATGATDEEGTGFAAMDISFADADGNEVEPTGDVYVNIDAAGILPEDADPESVTVQHLAEDETGAVASVDTVADTAEDTEGVATAVDTTNVRAAFSVDGFSTFTITWKSGRNTTSVDFECFEIANDGGISEIDEGVVPALASRSSVANGTRIPFDSSNDDLSISGYTFDHATYEFSENSGELTSIEIGREGRFSQHWYVSFNDGAHQNKNDKPVKINLYYKKNSSQGGGQNPGGGGTVTQNATVTTGKTAVLREDGNYDLTLSVSGTRGSAKEKAAVDVLFIVDRSASMTNNGSRRLANAKTAMNTLVNSLEGNENIDARYSIVTFSGGTDSKWGGSAADASLCMGWTAVEGHNVSNSINGITASGGTDYEAGLDKGLTQLGSARSNAVKVVIFLSDGEPTWSYDYGYGTDALCRVNHGSNRVHTCTYEGWVDTLGKASRISCGYFYAISLGGEASDYMNDLVDKVNAPTKQAIEAKSDGSNLKDLFEDITADVTFFAAKDVTITDPLSDYADLVLTNNAPQFTITITREASEGVEGESWTGTVGPNGAVSFQDLGNQNHDATARVSEDNRTIYLDLPDDYELEPGYTYSVSTVITPSQAAITAGMNSDEAKNTPDPGTGTHADKNEQGFWSNVNENAKVTFTANGAAGSESFPKPVIRVPATGSLTINKDVEGATLSGVHSYEFTITTTTDMTNALATYGDNATQLRFSKADNDNIWSASLSVSASNADDGEHNGSVTISGLPVGEYTVTESTDDDSVGLAHYEFGGVEYVSTDADEETSGDTGTVNIGGNETATVTVTNTYIAHQSLTIHKISDQGGTPLQGAIFKLYRVEGSDDNLNHLYYVEANGVVAWAADEDDASSLTSDASGNLTFNDLDTNQTYYLVETNAPDGYVQLDKEIEISWDEDENHWIARYVGGGDDLFNSAISAVNVTNSTGAALPETGGFGTTFGTIGGVLLVAAAVCGYGLRRRHEGRGARS